MRRLIKGGMRVDIGLGSGCKKAATSGRFAPNIMGFEGGDVEAPQWDEEKVRQIAKYSKGCKTRTANCAHEIKKATGIAGVDISTLWAKAKPKR